jgi:hypothetical protein
MMHRNPALQRQFRDVDSGLSYGRLAGLDQPPGRLYLILSVTENFRTPRSQPRSVTHQPNPHPDHDHIRAPTEPERTPNTRRQPRSAPALTSPNPFRVRNGSDVGPTPFPRPRPAPCGGSGGKAYQPGPDQARCSPAGSAAGDGPAPTWRAASVYGSPVAAIRARIACLRSLFCVMTVSFRRRSHALRQGMNSQGNAGRARESLGPLSSSPPAAWAPASSEAGGRVPPLPAP